MNIIIFRTMFLPYIVLCFLLSVIPSHASPVVINVFPPDGSTNVPASSIVKATFSETIQSSSLTVNSFTLSELVNITKIAGGYAQSVVLRENGTMFAWGNNYNVEKVPTDLSGFVSIAAGTYHTVALKDDGSVVVWGGNNAGQKDIPTGLTSVVAISAQGESTVALKDDGTLVAWGGNIYIPENLTGVSSASMGGAHIVALKNDGSVVAWGTNSHGQTDVPTDLSGVVAVAAGSTFSVALKGDGTVVAWGQNFYGSTDVPTDLSGVVAVAAGETFVAALKEDGSVVAWGLNSQGQTDVPTDLPKVSAIAAGYAHVLVLLDDGTVRGWGGNWYTQATVPPKIYESFIHGTLAYDTQTYTASLAPLIEFSPDTHYLARITTDLSNLEGIHLETNVEWSFISSPETGGLIKIPKTGQTTSYASGDDGDIQAGVAWPNPRFTDNSDGTVADNLTGLIWLKNTNCFGGLDWASALASISALENNSCSLSDGSAPNDWRLPNINELGSLVDIKNNYPALPAGHPFTNTPSNASYWSSTTGSDAVHARTISIGSGLDWDRTKNESNRVWPVRGGGVNSPIALPKTGQVVSYAANDDGAQQKGLGWPSPRFADNNDGTITDNLTGLIWLKKADCLYRTWDEGLATANALASGSCELSDGSASGDWRLPNLLELKSLIDRSRYSPALPDSHPFTVNTFAPFWTSSALSSGPTAVYRISIENGNEDAQLKTSYSFVWPVRGGQVFPSDITYQPLPSGPEITVNPYPDTEITFPNVPTNCTISIDRNATSQVLPTNFTIFGEVLDIDISCPNVSGTVCLSYDDSIIPDPEGDIRLIRENGSSWQDMTSILNTSTNEVCGQTNDFTMFAVAKPVNSGALPPVVTPILPEDTSITIPGGPGRPPVTIAPTVPVSAGGCNISTFGLTTPLPPANYRIVGDIAADIDFPCATGLVEVCLYYEDADVFGNELELRLFHRDSIAGWQNITDPVTHDTVTNEICGTVSSFSPFAVVEPLATGPVLLESTQSTFDNIQDAYAKSVFDLQTSDMIKVKAGDQQLPATLDLLFNQNVTIRLEGGYDDTFSTVTPVDTEYTGTLTIMDGSVTISDLIIK